MESVSGAHFLAKDAKILQIQYFNKALLLIDFQNCLQQPEISKLPFI